MLNLCGLKTNEFEGNKSSIFINLEFVGDLIDKRLKNHSKRSQVMSHKYFWTPARDVIYKSGLKYKISRENI
jgi:hypothetical protein